MLPKNSWLSVKNTKHQSTLNTPLIPSSQITFLGKFSFLIHNTKITAKVKYKTLHTTGITKLGIHSLGLTKLSNHSLPSCTNSDPSPATKTIAIKLITIAHITFFLSLSIYLLYANCFLFILKNFLRYLLSFCQKIFLNMQKSIDNMKW